MSNKKTAILYGPLGVFMIIILISSFGVFLYFRTNKYDEKVKSEGGYFIGRVVDLETLGNTGGNSVDISVKSDNNLYNFTRVIPDVEWRKLNRGDLLLIRGFFSDTLIWGTVDFEIAHSLDDCIKSVQQPKDGWNTIPSCSNSH